MDRKEAVEQHRRWTRSGGTWALVLLPAVMVFVLLLRPVWDVDIFWQLRLGEMILAAGRPILREPFAAMHLGETMPSVAWAGQAIFAAIRDTFGWTGLRVFDALCWCGGFWLLAAACRRRDASTASVALGLGLCFMVALPTASIRPQNFAALCFGALLALLKLELRNWQTVALGTVILVTWQNLHPSSSMGAIALTAHAGGNWVAWIRDRERDKPWPATVLVLVALASLFATPDGLGVLAISARNAQASIAVRASEWLPLWTTGNVTNALPVIAVALIAALIALRYRSERVSWSDLAVSLVLLILTVSAYRFVLFWAIATVPVIAAWSTREGRGKCSQLLCAVGALALATWLALMLRPTHFSPNLPMAAVAKLETTRVTGTIYTEPEFGGVLIDAGYPRWRVSLDGRYYRYTDEEWAQYGDVLAGNLRLHQIVRMYHPAAFVLRPSHTTALCAELDRPNSGWQRIWLDEGAAVWVPRTRRN